MPAIAQPEATEDAAYMQGFWAGSSDRPFSSAYLAFRAEYGTVAREYAMAIFRGWHTGREEAAESRRIQDAGEDRPERL